MVNKLNFYFKNKFYISFHVNTEVSMVSPRVKQLKPILWALGPPTKKCVIGFYKVQKVTYVDKNITCVRKRPNI